MEQFDVAVIGGGAAGMAAALSARKWAAEKVILLERNDELGGILQQCIHNGFGSLVFKEDLPGPLYAQRFIDQILASDIRVELEAMVIGITPDKIITVTGKKCGFKRFSAKAVVLTMGCRERTRAQIMLPGSHPAGVFTAGTVQRFVNVDGMMPGKRFVILGSGDIGMIMARRLTYEGAKVVKVVELLPFLTGLRRNHVQCLQEFDIPLELSTTVSRVIGEKRLEAVETVRVDDALKPAPGSESIIPCDTLLLSVGLIPENELSLKLGIALDPLTGGPLVNQNMETSLPGFFSAGNVVSIQDLVDNVSLAGETAGKSAALFARGAKLPPESVLHVSPGKNIRSVVPQRIELPASDKIRIQIRSLQAIERPVSIKILSLGNPIHTVKKKYARPAEMIEITLPRSSLPTEPGSRLVVELRSEGEA
jgi:thioredoxin reductase